MVDDEQRAASQPRGQCFGKWLGGGTCVQSVKEQNYVFAYCNFVPVDGVEYFSGIFGRERYVSMFLCFQKMSLWTLPKAPSNQRQRMATTNITMAAAGGNAATTAVAIAAIIVVIIAIIAVVLAVVVIIAVAITIAVAVAAFLLQLS